MHPPPALDRPKNATLGFAPNVASRHNSVGLFAQRAHEWAPYPFIPSRPLAGFAVGCEIGECEFAPTRDGTLSSSSLCSSLWNVLACMFIPSVALCSGGRDGNNNSVKLGLDIERRLQLDIGLTISILRPSFFVRSCH